MKNNMLKMNEKMLNINKKILKNVKDTREKAGIDFNNLIQSLNV
jgi:hypothetical protein